MPWGWNGTTIRCGANEVWKRGLFVLPLAIAFSIPHVVLNAAILGNNRHGLMRLNGAIR
jgi:hypothetical protein